MRSPFRILRPKPARGLLCLAVLFGLGAMLLPLPMATLPSSSTEKDLSEPFPCQNRPCGCRSADQCWKKCCCFNDVQKVAWAKANHVKVPGFVLAAAKQAGAHSPKKADFYALKKPAYRCSRCIAKKQKPTKSSCCQQQYEDTKTVKAQCCETGCKSIRLQSEDYGRSAKSKPARIKWVLAVYAAECQGQGSFWFCLPASIVPERLTLVTSPEPQPGIFIVESESLRQASLAPPLPPPKIG
jgi:hypothetical protein